MKLRNILSAVLTALLVIGMLTGCAASAPSANMPADKGYTESYIPETTSAALTESDLSTDSAAPVNQKLIRTIYLEAETEDMDTLLSQISQRISQLGGYVENREIYNGSSYNSSRYRRASLTIRIPAEKLDGFVDQVAETSNIISNRETAEDVTLDYVATESRIIALETEQARLLELLAQAKDMDDLLKIETRLTEVRTALEIVSSQLRVYDNLVNYGTIHLDISEVRQYTVVEEPESIWQRIGKGFVKSLKNLWTILTEIFVFLIVALPYLVVIAAFITAIILLIKFTHRKKPKKQMPPPSEQKSE